MDGLDGLMLREARAVLQRCVPHSTSCVDWQGSSRFRGVSSWAGQACEGWTGAAQQKGAVRACYAESPPVGGLSAIRRSGCFRGKGTFR